MFLIRNIKKFELFDNVIFVFSFYFKINGSQLSTLKLISTLATTRKKIISRP